MTSPHDIPAHDLEATMTELQGIDFTYDEAETMCERALKSRRHAYSIGRVTVTYVFGEGYRILVG